MAMITYRKEDNPRVKAKILVAAQKLAETKVCFRLLERDLMDGMVEVRKWNRHISFL